MHPRLSLPLAGRRFFAPPLLRGNTAPYRLRAGRIGPARAFILFTLTTFPLATAIELLSIEPFSERHAHICTGELPIQFYGNAAERTYSAQAALVF